MWYDERDRVQVIVCGFRIVRVGGDRVGYVVDIDCGIRVMVE